MKLPLYPIKFTPILKEKVWGGNKLKTILGKNTASVNIGESWELSGVDNDISIVQNGFLNGNSVNELIEKYKEEFLGKKVFETYGTQFPLLFKFIDAKEVLSVQLHPGDELAKKRHNSFGKTEMWYIIQADENAELILGFNQKIDKKTYLNAIQNKNIQLILHKEKIKQGDAFYISPGFVHAIGAGVLLAEIQQTSDVTYRIFDWNRPDVDGNMRELHLDLAIDAIDFNPLKNFRLNVAKEELIKNPYFSVNQVSTEQNAFRVLKAIDSFVVYMCVSGETEINCGGVSENLKMGETVLIPAAVEVVNFQNGSAKLLEIFVPVNN
ncbi:type I phosphomannose isomerase catalytic subunit [Planktosalinus lacus]|uniref:Mannose-6-phosphate isomerase n=1 Tax=Planktosalinus lacus TaxID=1526573 RepID=A0A8J2YB91_9FLAO|nr:type I phosphomannose isomerase catalytic subunit [Planktosalinus lacus]GGE00719.1 mannose-6-phosphate isomerase [Planktosalinus lacus]